MSNHLTGKFPQYYNSLKSVLEKKKVADIIKEGAITDIAKLIYGNNPKDIDINELKGKDALSLISFYDFVKDYLIIPSSLKADVVEQLKSSFQPIGFNTLDNKDITNIAYLIDINKYLQFDVRLLLKQLNR